MSTEAPSACGGAPHVDRAPAVCADHGAASAHERSEDGDGGRPLVRAEDVEVILPSGDGVGPWTGTIRAGEQILLLGPSGAGKSTFLLALAGAVPSHVRARLRGRLRIDGRDPTADGVVALSDVVGYLGQDPADGVCLPDVADEIALPLENRCVPRARIGTQVASALRHVAAGHLQPRRTRDLSGGELQRVALAAATVAGPKLLLLDEPTAMLDADGVAAVRESLGSVVADAGVATVLVEHRLDEWAGDRGVAALPARTIALDRSGHVLADGPTAGVLAEHGRRLREEGCWLPWDLDQELAREDRGSDDDGARAEPEAGAEAGTGIATGSDARIEPGFPGLSGPSAVPRPLALRARSLTLGHGDTTVLSGIDLDLAAGDLVAVVGRNGAGKSTLLGALARLDQPRTGTVVGSAAGLVFQRPESQFVGTTVRDELADTGASPERIEEMLARLRLADWSGSSPFRLSGGQQRRLSLAAMLLRDRPVLLADEPGFGLDHAAHRTVMGMLRSAADEGRAVVMTTHDLRAVSAADAVVVIVDGTVLPPLAPAALIADRALMTAAGLVPSGGEGAGPVARAAAVTGSRGGTVAGAGAGAGAEPVEPAPAVPLAHRNPTVLLGLLTAVSGLCLFLTDPAPLAVLYLLLTIAVMVGTRMGPRRLLRGQLPFAVFAAGVFTVNVLSRPGREPWPDLPVRVTEEGLVLGAALALRALVIGLGALGVARATDPRRTMVSLQQHARLPARYALALLAGRRLLDDLPERWSVLTRAHRVRLPLRADGSVPPLGPRRLLGCAFGLLVDVIRAAERIALALESRGLDDGPRTVWRPVPLTWVDTVLVVAVAGVVTGVLIVV
ncbi:energy-coupling factor ABC transporter ATP-binding protein [Brachybacterium sp. P6-10-X1]|uniref:ATP-binding cassette domain-containing protein n=1 Tax=Brachybacterium sp. P6-10-X1 TaxID=1903186 RepID=UPI0009717E14|nr:ATP-binding cassette domain-containing protein [Brachybacterium sp. P6-10-X1]APX32687.1 energy-coupling factor ABC transporter ATP-binding protein [Brachybacterium sp. P6-10-X1]